MNRRQFCSTEQCRIVSPANRVSFASKSGGSSARSRPRHKSSNSCAVIRCKKPEFGVGICGPVQNRPLASSITEVLAELFMRETLSQVLRFADYKWKPGLESLAPAKQLVREGLTCNTNGHVC